MNENKDNTPDTRDLWHEVNQARLDIAVFLDQFPYKRVVVYGFR